MPLHCFQEPKLQVLLKHQDTARKSLKTVLVSAFLKYQKTKMERKSECLSWRRSIESFIILAFSMISGPTAGHWARADAYRLHIASSTTQKMRRSGYPQQSAHPRAPIIISRKLQTSPVSDVSDASRPVSHCTAGQAWSRLPSAPRPLPSTACPSRRGELEPRRVSQHAQCQVWGLVPPASEVW